MMQKRLLSLLLITIAVLAIGLMLTQRQQPAEDMHGDGSALVPDLSASLNAVSSVKITKAKDELIAELVRGDNGWTVANRHNYPADIAKVREYLIKLSDAKLRETKTSKPENYGRLGVMDLSGADATGFGVELGGLKAPAKLIVGMSSAGGSPGTFVRRSGEAASYLVNGDVIPDKETGNWLVREIVDMPSTDVLSVVVTAPDKSVLKIDKPDAAAFNYTVQGIPKGRELSSESAGNLTAGGLASVTLEDALPVAEANPDAASTFTATYVGYDGLVIDATLWDRDGKTWSTFAARIDDARVDAWVASEQTKADAARSAAEADAAAKAAATPTPADAKPGETAAAADAAAAATPPLPAAFDAAKAKADKRADLDKRVAAINARTSPWAYAIPTWKAANIKKKLEDLLAPKPAK